MARSTVVNWKDMTLNQRIMSIAFTALAATPIIIAIAQPAYTATTPIKTSKGDIIIWKGFTLRGRPVIGVSFKHLTVGKYGIQYPSWIAQEVKPGWVPGAKGVDAHVLATRTALSKMGFGQAEISRIMVTTQLTKLMTSPLVRIPKPQAEALLQSIKNLDEKELTLVLKEIAKAGKNVDKIYGSYSIRAVLGEALSREVADLDIQMLQDTAWTKSWVQSLVKQLNKLNPGKFRIAAGRATLIEALGTDGQWHHALDIHCQGEIVPYTIAEGAYGMKFARNPITINVPDVGKLRLMALKENVVRKMASVLEWRGKGEVGPPAYRFKDVTDFYDMARFVLGENYANAWAVNSGLDPAKLAALADKNPAVVTWVIDMSPSTGLVPTVNFSPPAVSAAALKELGVSPGVSPTISQPLVAPPLQLVSPAVSPASVESSVSLSISQAAPKLSPSILSTLSKAVSKKVSPLVSKGTSPSKISTAISKTLSSYVSKGVISPSDSRAISQAVSQAVSPPPTSPPSAPVSPPAVPTYAKPLTSPLAPPSIPPTIPSGYFPPGTKYRITQATVKNVTRSPSKPGIVSWRQGIVWVSVFPPFRAYQRHGKTLYRALPFVKGQRVDVVYTKQPPPLAKRYKGTPFQTCYSWRGTPPEELTLDMGVVDVKVVKGHKISFKRVRAQVLTKAPEKPPRIPRRKKYPEPEKLLYAEVA